MAGEKTKLNVEGMSCMHCVHAIQTALGSLPGISKVEVDLMGKEVAVEYDAEQINIQAITDKIVEAGYEIV